MKTSIREKRLQALYDYARSEHKDKEVLSILLAIIPHSIVKKACEELNIKVK